jgi:3-deoxy-7-phosphoheptulonate synthase
MVVVMEANAPEAAIEAVVSYLVGTGSDVHRSSGEKRTLLGVVGTVTDNDAAVVSEMDGVAKVVRVSEPYKLASRRFRHDPSIVDGAWGAIGGDHPWIAIEPIGAELSANDDRNPPSMSYEVAAGRPFDAAVSRLAEAPEYVGALACLSTHGHARETRWPVRFVTRDPTWTLEQWLESAERELTRGADQVVLLEAGGAYPDGTRALDVVSLVRARAATHLPIVVDVPKVATFRKYVADVACAAVAAGASGVILRVFVGSPGEAPRAPATLNWDTAVEVAERLRAIGEAVRA